MIRFKPLLFVGVTAVGLSALPLHARQLSLDEALRLVPTSFNSASTRASADLLYTEKSDGLNVAYIVSAGDGEGYLVLAADDLLPAVLGYADSGNFDPVSMPPAMADWLAEYGRQLSYAVHNGIGPAESKAVDRQSVAPLCVAKWNQSSPFNNNTPVYEGKRTPTGCTATAMAQVMYAHQWPVKGEGTNSYVSATIREKLTFDFGATTFEWTNMLPSYSGAYTEEQAAAVAKLMEACGNAALMTYNKNASGAYPYDAIYGMVNFMGYDKSAVMLERNYYTSEEWDELVYGELAAGRPVIYGGYNSSNGGHTFIVDGYSQNGFYHLNWGWGGMSDGYFLLTALNPKDQGIGGSASGYNFNQDAIINVMPARDDSNYSLEIMWDGSFAPVAKSYTSRGMAEFKVGADGTYRAFTLRDVTARMGLLLTPEDGGEVFFCPGSDVSFKSYYGSYISSEETGFTVNVADMPKEGTYIAIPAFEYDGIVREVAVKVGEMRSTKMTCSKMGVKFEDISVERTLTASNVKIGQKALYSGKNCTITVDITNSGEEYLGTITAGLVSGEGTVLTRFPGVPVNLTDGESVNITFSGILNSYDGVLPSGKYDFQVYDGSGVNILEQPVSVTVLPVPQDKLTYDFSMSVLGNDTGDGTIMSPYLVGDHVDMAVKVEVFTGLFDDRVSLYPYYDNGSSYGDDTDFTTSTVFSKNFFVTPGDSETLTYELGTADFELDKLVYVQAYGWKSDGSVGSEGFIGRKIYMKRVMNGINELKVSNMGIYPNPTADVVTVISAGAICGVKVYSLTGACVIDHRFNDRLSSVDLDVSGLTSGQYVMVVISENGMDRHRLIKR